LKTLVTGHRGYVGSLLVPRLLEAGAEVTGMDSDLFRGSDFGSFNPPVHPELLMDVRDVSVDQVFGFDAVVHLAGISNDPLGNLNPEATYEINYLAAVRLAKLAKGAGVSRFLFASSCSNYGAGGPEILDEKADFRPVTPYGRSKVRAEREIRALADEDFSPVFLRGGTAYGVSPRLRADLVVNNLTGYAITTGEVLLKSDGTPWRPLVHVEDLAASYVAALEAPRRAIHNQAFNVGSDAENYQVKEIAQIVQAAVPGSRIEFAPDAGPDIRDYRVTFKKIQGALPTFRPKWDLVSGVKELVDAYKGIGVTREDFLGPSWMRIQEVQRLISEGDLTSNLRWTYPAPVGEPVPIS